jgi:hypothetical protein
MSIENAIPEAKPPRYDEWVRAFTEFEARIKEERG